MYTVTRYSRPARPASVFNDFDSLQRQVDQLLFGRSAPSSVRSVGRAGFPAINVGTTAESVEVFAFAPGIDATAIEVTLDKGLLTLSGERKAAAPKDGEKLNVIANERSSGSFRRVIRLPDDVDAQRVTATYRDGVLQVSVARRVAEQPRRIEVKGAH
jgi:HSP20 family protein